MPLIEWNNSFSVQNAEMDHQHQHLFGLLNTLHGAMSQGKSKDSLPRVFEELIQYTQRHFAAEEALMQKYNYPGFVIHQRQHADLIAQVAQLHKRFLAGDLSVSIHTRDFLKEWLVEHIKGSDQKYSMFLK
jgi:hemerythrin-like metal-binding protein